MASLRNSKIDTVNIGVKPKDYVRIREKKKAMNGFITSVISNDQSNVNFMYEGDVLDSLKTPDSVFNARLLAKAGNYFYAEQMYYRLNFPQKKAYSEIAEICLREKSHEKAAEYFMKAGQFENAGDSFLESGKFFAAGRCFDKAGNREKSLRAYTKGGIVALDEKNYGIALECLERSNRKDLLERTRETIDRISKISDAKIDAARKRREERKRLCPTSLRRR
ncbi:MAG: hypothetical protein NTY68_01440 [Candidatus Micrarchaeota archaeon]|nr:hypothetical protein [Candidatus Micrarchaeota archaeon]